MMTLTDPIFLSGIVVVLVILIGVLAYNLYQENRHRKQAYARPIGADQDDALVDNQVASVHDGQVRGEEAPVLLKGSKVTTEPVKTPKPMRSEHLPVETKEPEPELPVETADNNQPVPIHLTFVEGKFSSVTRMVKHSEGVQSQAAKSEPKHKQFAEHTCLVDPETLKQNEFACFDRRFDLLMYVGLDRWQEVKAIPRFSRMQHCQLLGQGQDGVFRVVEPIPDKRYRAFVIGMQGVSRAGLVSLEEIAYFQQQVMQFAQEMGGKVASDDVQSYVARAQEMDEWCKEMDYLLDIHLIPVQKNTKISGQKLYQSVQKLGFVLQNNGVFVYQRADGAALCALTLSHHKPFGESSFHQEHDSVVMSFDPPNVRQGEHGFAEFMYLVTTLVQTLDLELVDAEHQPLSEEWLIEASQYVSDLQKYMKERHLEAGSKLAARLFS